jgi:hypothetical protein
MSRRITIQKFLGIEGLDFFYDPQKPGRRSLVLGLDPSWGVTDYSALQGISVEDATQVLEYQGKLSPTELFALLKQVSLHTTYFKIRMLIIESNTGRDLIDRYQTWLNLDENYSAQSSLPILYYERVGEMEKKNLTKRYGFQVTAVSRPLLLARFREVLNSAPDIVRSMRLLSEMQSFVVDSKGRERSSSGYHDDLIFAYALALKGREDYIFYWAPLEVLRERGGEKRDERPIPIRANDYLTQQEDELNLGDQLGFKNKDAFAAQFLDELRGNYRHSQE